MTKEIENHFARADSNGDGAIDLAEFLQLVRGLGLNRSESVVERVFSSIDANGDGRIDLDEFSSWWGGVDSG